MGPRCTVSGRSGDPWLVPNALDPMFAGAATNYAVAYLDGPAPAGSVVAQRLGAPEGLAAGYHLLRMAPWTREAGSLIFEPDPQPEDAVITLEIQPGHNFGLVLATAGGL
jgi:hypothetical protein